ncbi:hypothetical protein [Streptomyces sp. NBC_01314]|uniref:effector-associated constant component EACC1 n=1 Tax=Streptomyces sp. NBC_01314 TaxID=2903821 RepID=UPI003086A46C|nr:hypothetical protein OG622_23205 [Streptomyces sp. NBC_01314]
MRIEIGVPADQSGAVLLDLHRWLRQDDDVRRHAQVRLAPPAHPSGTMDAVEVIDLVLGQTFAALNLALAYATWRAARPAAPAVTVSSAGVSVTVRDGSEESIRRIVEMLDSLPRGGPGEPGAPGAG